MDRMNSPSAWATTFEGLPLRLEAKQNFIGLSSPPHSLTHLWSMWHVKVYFVDILIDSKFSKAEARNCRVRLGGFAPRIIYTSLPETLSFKCFFGSRWTSVDLGMPIFTLCWSRLDMLLLLQTSSTKARVAVRNASSLGHVKPSFLTSVSQDLGRNVRGRCWPRCWLFAPGQWVIVI